MRFAAALVALGVAWAVWAARPGAPHEGYTEGETIFVSIASYRDADCVNTLKSMFDMADAPRRVFVGVCEQNTAASEEVCLPADFAWHDQVRRLGIPSREAKGPTYARYLCSTLYRGETYFLQLDSHMRFVKGWDTKAIAMLRRCPSPKAVLTHYPHDVEHMADAEASVPVLCKAKFDDSGIVTFDSATLPPGKQPRPVPFTAGGFLFAPGSVVREVPFDPDLPHLFQGEELLYSARLWTAGFDFYTPTENVVYHHYYRREAPKFWSDLDYQRQQRQTVAKVRRLLRGEMPGYAYGMGSARTLEEYFEFAGIDWGARQTSTETKFCSPV